MGGKKQNRLRRLSGGEPTKENVPPLVHHWLKIHAEAGTFRFPGDQRRQVMLVQEPPGREHEPA